MTDDAPRTPYRLFGIECDEGWEPLYKPIIEKITAVGGEVLQVKEKFGALRIYFGAPGEHYQTIADEVMKAENASTTICELCGDAGTNEMIAGWWRTLCKEHQVYRREAYAKHGKTDQPA